MGSSRSGGGGRAGLWFSIQDLLTHGPHRFLLQKVRAGRWWGRCLAGRESGVFTEPCRHKGKQAHWRLVKQRNLGQDFKSSGKSPGYTTQPASELEASRPGSQAFCVLRVRASAGASRAARSQIKCSGQQTRRAAIQDAVLSCLPADKPWKGHLRVTNQEDKGKAGWGSWRGIPAEEGGSHGGSSEEKVFKKELGLCRSFNKKIADHGDKTKFCGFFVVVVNNSIKNCCVFILKCPGKTKGWTTV